MSNIFTIQTPEIYESIYNNKCYGLESIILLSNLIKFKEPKWKTLEIGAGSGQLYSFINNYCSEYTAVEPSELMFNRFKEKFVKDKNNHRNLEIIQKSFQNFIDTSKELNYELIIANFNVFNYLSWYELKDYFIKIKNKSQSNLIVAFDTWSLDYVKLRPKKQTSNVKFRIKGTKDNNILMERVANSIFNERNDSINIKFEFFQKGDKTNLVGVENHVIYPFDLKSCINEIQEFSKKIITIPFLNLEFNNEKINTSLFRNWLVIFEINN